jgi:hypothetical protein
VSILILICEAFVSAKENGQIVDRDQIFVFRIFSKFSVDDDAASARQVRTEEEEERQKTDKTLNEEIGLSVYDSENRRKNEIGGSPHASPDTLCPDKSNSYNLK